MKVEVVHVVFALDNLHVLTSVIVELDWVKARDIAVVNLYVELLDVVLLILRTDDWLKLKPVVDQSELALHLAQACAVVNNYAQIVKVSFYVFNWDGKRKVT